MGSNPAVGRSSGGEREHEHRLVLSIWIAMAVSSRAGDVRVAQQLGTLAVLPVLLAAYLVTFGVIPLTPVVVLAVTGVVLLLDVVGWRLVSAAFDRERLITSTR